jgi:two-component system, NarL family, response regulator LiaR
MGHASGFLIFGRRNRSRAVSAILLRIPIMKRHVLIFGLVGGLLIATLQYTEYRFIVIEHSIELYGALVAILFAAFGIWLGLRITGNRETVKDRETGEEDGATRECRAMRERESALETVGETIVLKEVLAAAEASASFAPNAVAFAPSMAPFAPDTVAFAPNATQQPTQQRGHKQDRQRLQGITARELEILTLVARGLSNREIATQLFVSENTVKTHCARAFDKLGAARRTQAVQRGKELGLLP